MDELLPAARLVGMGDPLRWMHDVAARLPGRPPRAPPEWLIPRQCLGAVRWYESLVTDLISIFLLAHADHLDLGVWTTAWDMTA